MALDETITALEDIQQRVLWLSTNMIDVANHHRHRTDTLKVGGHQASCASMVTMMTALYFHYLDAHDYVAVKPHGAPVLHAINYLLEDLDESYLSRLRHFGGLQAYPSRTKDPDRVDFSTGSVGLGPAATIFSAYARAYVDAHFSPRPRSRFISILGDAELDEGNIWEAVHDPQTPHLNQLRWLVDFNRQSLDRIVPDMRISPWTSAFSAHGWDVQIVKYGSRLRKAFHDPGGDILHQWIDQMPNEHYQSLFSCPLDDIRSRFLEGAPYEMKHIVSDYDDASLKALVTDLGGHDMTTVIEALEASERSDSPSVIFFYTHKGWGLPTVGNPRNHSAVLSDEQFHSYRESIGVDPNRPWARFDPHCPAGRLIRSRIDHLKRPLERASEKISIPISSGIKISSHGSTQAGFGHILTALGRDERIARLMVTTAPDVATSTNLAGWINKFGVFTATHRREWIPDPLLRWRESPHGRHIELGIAEMNFFTLLAALGLSKDFSSQTLLPIGTVYDPFICRGLDALIYASYLGASFIVAGTPSGVTLAPEGGAHQSSITASIGIELPGITMDEPAYIQALDWLLCDQLSSVASSDSTHPHIGYMRLTTRSIDQGPFAKAVERFGSEDLRRYICQGAYELIPFTHPKNSSQVTIVASGAIMPEAIEAVQILTDEGIDARIVDICSPGRIYRAWNEAIRTGISQARPAKIPDILSRWFEPHEAIVTVHDASSHALAWIGSAVQARKTISLGVDAFGQSGAIADLYRAHLIDAESIVNASLIAIDA